MLHLCPIPNLDFNKSGMTTMIVMTMTVAAAVVAARQQLQPPGLSRRMHGLAQASPMRLPPLVIIVTTAAAAMTTKGMR